MSTTTTTESVLHHSLFHMHEFFFIQKTEVQLLISSLVLQIECSLSYAAIVSHVTHMSNFKKYYSGTVLVTGMTFHTLPVRLSSLGSVLNIWFFNLKFCLIEFFCKLFLLRIDQHYDLLNNLCNSFLLIKPAPMLHLR